MGGARIRLAHFTFVYRLLPKKNKAQNKQKQWAQDFSPHLPDIYFSEHKNTFNTETYLKYLIFCDTKKYNYRQAFFTSLVFQKLFITKYFFRNLSNIYFKLNFAVMIILISDLKYLFKIYF